jgi:cytoskeletal protein CcmA (bactofilin family)
MALWNFKSKEKFEDVDSIAISAPRTDSAAVAVVVSNVRHATSVIAADVVVSGSILAPGDVNIDGRVIGDVRAATIIVGRDGDVKGNVTAETATIRGRVLGDVRARTIQLASTGSVEGDLSHAVLIIEEGGVFEGRSKRAADPLSELALIAPADEGDAKANNSSVVTADLAETDIVVEESEAKDAQTETLGVAVGKTEAHAKDETKLKSEGPGSGLNQAPRSGVADALGDRFAVAD